MKNLSPISEDTFFKIFSSSPIMMMIFELETLTILDTNEAYIQKLGYPKEEIINIPGKAGFAIEKKRREELVMNLKMGKRITDFDLDITTKHGKIINAILYIQPLELSNKQIFSVQVIDVSERKRVEEELNRSKIFFEQQFQQSAISRQIFDPDGWTIKVNPKFCELFGVKKEDVEGKYNMFHDEEAAVTGVQDKFRWVLEHKKPIEHEVFFDIKHASESSGVATSKPTKIWFQLVLNPILDKDGKLINIVLEHKDVTKRKQAEKELKKSEEKYKYLFESMAQGVFYKSADGSLIDVNQSALDMFGLTRNQFLRRDSYDPGWKVINEDGSDLIPDKHPSIIALKTGKEVKNAVLGIFNPKTNEYKFLSVYAKPLFKEDEKKPYQVFVTLHDITERKQSETALKESSDLLLNLTAQVPGAIYQFLLRPDGTSCFPYSSMGIKDIYGVTPEQIKTSAELLFAALHPDDLKSISEKIQKSADNLSPWRDEYRVILPGEKEPSWREGYAIPEKLEDGSTLWHGFITNIDQRKQAEERIHEMNSRLSSIIESPGNMIIFSLDKNYCYTAFNKKHYSEMKKVYNTKIEVGKNMLDYISIEQVKLIAKKSFVRVLNGESFTEVQQQADMEIYYEFSWNPIFDFNNEISGLSCFIQDITERKRAENALRESEEKYKNLSEKSITGIYIIQDEKMVYVNPRICKLFGYAEDEIVGKLSPVALIHPDDGPRLVISLKGRFDGEILEDNIEYRAIKKDGSIFYVEVHSTIVDFNGKPAVQGTLINVTERKQAEKALRESEERFSKSFYELPTPMFILDLLTGERIIVNESFAKIVGYSRSEILARNLYGNNFAYDQNQLNEIIILIKGKGLISDEYLQVVNKSGEIISVLVSAAKLNIGDGNSIVVSYKDITENEKNEKLLKKTYSELQELKNQIEKENIYLKEEIKLEHNFGEIVGKSKTLKKMLKQIEQVSITNTTVLILGETGTGKELVARAIHELSDRRNRTLVKINCSAIPAELIESELFGHEKGAFTGAINKKIGRFELAHKGTIFLDEIGDLPLSLQSRLLRVLQESEFERVGSSFTQKVDVRIIAATNRNLEKLVLEGEFRQDLYYRLNVFPITCPALKERKEDIPLLVNHFVNKFNPKVSNKVTTVQQKTINALKNYYWPGNIRELEHVIERAMVLSQDEQLKIGNWFLQDSTTALVEKEITTLEENEREYIIKVIEQTNWKIRGRNGAAEILGLKPTTLESRMKKLGIKR